MRVVRGDWSLDEYRVASRHTIAPTPCRACTGNSALGFHAAGIRSQRVLGLIVVASVRSVASRVAQAPGSLGACARTRALDIRGAAISTQWVLGLIEIAASHPVLRTMVALCQVVHISQFPCNVHSLGYTGALLCTLHPHRIDEGRWR